MAGDEEFSSVSGFYYGDSGFVAFGNDVESRDFLDVFTVHVEVAAVGCEEFVVEPTEDG